MRTPTRNVATASTERAEAAISCTLACMTSLDRDRNIGDEEKLILVYSRSHCGFMELDKEYFGVDYYPMENKKRGEGGEIKERSILLWLPGIREGEDARPDQGWIIDYGK